MNSLYLISILLWLILTSKCISGFIISQEEGFSKREVITVTILLLAGLNIAKGIMYLFVPQFIYMSGQTLLEYFLLGSSLFQLLLSHFVLIYISNYSEPKRTENDSRCIHRKTF